MTYIRTCPRCGKVFVSPEALDRHWNAVGKDEPQKEMSKLVAVFQPNGRPFT